ncbi:acyltransferase [Bacteroides graminisolvens]
MRIINLFIRLLPQPWRLKVLFFKFSKRVTLIGSAHFFGEHANVVLLWGSSREDVVMKSHSELFGTIMSYNHGKVTLGEWGKVGKNCLINCVNSITIGDDCAIADNVTIVDHNYHPINPSDGLYMRHTSHGSRERQPMYSANAPIVIGKNVWLGNNVRVCKGVTIGDNSVIGANSIVTKDIPANCVAVGNPAHVVKTDIDRTTTSIFPL